LTLEIIDDGIVLLLACRSNVDNSS
jgi:hypothetical protein